ncbi:tRNA 2-selenouridine(34) synthase MnmH [Desulfurobacterium thermolithotrophum]|uniref:tRNA 2-selenouridine(34) synthase MnmH n=1 Tax=Desulfurobacterium thermolithotrophum TaxID=64160 RepID=UPI0013D40DC7|nr:tRNA 2-selenouridine(34) synthase MnmH [Desulfurobacterium thermolithotrophum]
MEIVKEIDIEAALKKGFVFIDVRTEEEFEEFHIPGALNIPLFTKEERERISEIYYLQGEKEARFFALEIAGPKLHVIAKKIKEIKDKHKNVVVYCWRGGMRSLAVASICNLTGVHVLRLSGGYRAFRHYILKRLEEICKKINLIILYGPTGVGKTRILKKLKKEGYPVIDLEGLAGHRGSVFGGIGLSQPSQKMFDSLLWLELEKLKDYPYVITEGESKKIGKLFIPDSFWRAMERGKKIQIITPLEERIKVSMEDYGVGRFSSDIYIKALSRIKKILGDEKYNEIKKLIEEESYYEAIKELMVNYYDKLYRRSTPEVERTITARNVEEAISKLRLELDC